MKNVYMVHITLPDTFSAELYKLLPKHRAFINDLMDQRIILSYSLDMARKNVWAVFELNSEAEVVACLQRFPLIRFIEYQMHELAYHDTVSLKMQELIMN